ncbi:FecR family protein [Pedobacter nyackensis]|uniref:FecR family protein n=1 Tax=Pedobacter nyackensis TaxID=475255 RepID=UPI00293146EF|nr:FecR domain-containing protein [Pedobacter nyackensis]
MEKELINQLIARYQQGKASADEVKLIETYYRALEHRADPQGQGEQFPDENTWNEIKSNIDLNIYSATKQPRTFKLWKSISVAAAVIAFIGICIYLYKPATEQATDTTIASNIKPGKAGATLTLANGKQILINDALAGNIASQSGVKISKSADGQILYEVTDQNSSTTEYNTLTTIQGEETRVKLPDGSIVYLNAASEIKYPTSFAKLKNRTIELTGEAYFEIAKDKSHPFIVTTDKQTVEVLGTHFNIQAYADEAATKTTLLEGSVKVAEKNAKSSNSKAHILKPGQQAVNSASSEISIKQVDTEEAVAWKNGFFIFENETMETAMRKISRWYNVDIIFKQQELKKDVFGGSVSRSENILGLLRVLSKAANVNMQAEGKSIIISKK